MSPHSLLSKTMFATIFAKTPSQMFDWVLNTPLQNTLDVQISPDFPLPYKTDCLTFA